MSITNQSQIHIPFDVEEAKETGFICTGTSGSGKTTLAKHLVKQLMDNGIICIIIDTSQAWNPENHSPMQHVEVIRSPLFTGTVSFDIKNMVYDVSRLTIAERFTFTNALCKAIMTMRVNHPNPKSLPWIFLMFEEAQLYLPNGCMRSLRKYGDVLNVVSVGRNFHVRFGLITQFPANVDKAPVKITQQRYFGWTSEKNDVTYIKSFLGKEESEKLKTLGKLRFIYQYKDKLETFNVPYYEEPKQAELSCSINMSYNIG